MFLRDDGLGQTQLQASKLETHRSQPTFQMELQSFLQIIREHFHMVLDITCASASK